MEAENFYKKLHQHFEEELPFVVYREPQLEGNVPIKALLQKNSKLYKIHDYTESGFVFSPFVMEKGVVYIPDTDSEKLILLQQPEENILFSGNPDSANRAPWEADLPQERENHLHLVKKAVKAINEGEMEKVVVSRKEVVHITGKHPLELFQELLQNYPTAFVYCWYHSEIGLWLGATPETLLRTEGSNFRTMALAGTQNFSGSIEVNWGEKEKQEQQYVTDSILEDLESLKLFEDINVSEAFTSKAGNLLHLRTDISGRLPSSGKLEQIIRSLHPTPAVCGLPKEKAQQFILKEEDYDREFYTGFLGELNIQEKRNRSRNRRNIENLAYSAIKKKTSLFVNLRCMKLENENAHLFVGGGITKDSVPEDEWRETVNKAQTMKKVLGMDGGKDVRRKT